MKSAGSAGDEYIFFSFKFTTPKKCKQSYCKIIIRYKRIKRFM